MKDVAANPNAPTIVVTPHRGEVISKTEKRVFGHCTKFRMRFGCHTVIGKTNKGVMPVERRFSRVCVD